MNKRPFFAVEWIREAYAHESGVAEFLGVTVGSIGVLAFALERIGLLESSAVAELGGYAALIGLGAVVVLRLLSAPSWIARRLRAEIQAVQSENKSLGERLHRYEAGPDFHFQMAAPQLGTIAPSPDAPPTHVSVILAMRITNHGAPSGAHDWRVGVKLPDGSKHLLAPVEVSVAEGIEFKGEMGGVITGQNLMTVRSLALIPTGGRVVGYFVGLLPLAIEEQLAAPGCVWRVGCHDYLNRPFDFRIESPVAHGWIPAIPGLPILRPGTPLPPPNRSGAAEGG